MEVQNKKLASASAVTAIRKLEALFRKDALQQVETL